MSRAMCIDLGGTNLRIGLSQTEAPAELVPAGKWPAPPDLAAFSEQIGALIRQHAVERVGIAVPGLAHGTRCVWIPNLAYLDGVDLAEVFAGTQIALGNDAQLALLAETVSGSARGLTDAVLLAIGTGIGSAVLAGGRIVRGHRGGATSFGWACADPFDPGDARSGWLERKASGRALDALARRMGLPDGAALIALARSGDADARARLADPAAALGAALSGAVSLLGSQAVVISGGVAEGLDVLEPLIAPVLRRQVPPHLRDVRLSQGRFGAGASLVGASLAAHGSALWEEPQR